MTQETNNNSEKIHEKLIPLDSIKLFSQPKAALEQYPTPKTLVNKIMCLFFNDIQEQQVLDLGAGTGMLGIAAALCDAKNVTCIEKDKDAYEILCSNISALNATRQTPLAIHTLNSDILFTDIKAETIIMNPPFGTRNAHIDRAFLDYALTHANVIITMHKTSTIDGLKTRIHALGATITYEENILFPLEKTMKHQTKEKEYIEVTLLRIIV